MKGILKELSAFWHQIHQEDRLIDRLPPVRGYVASNEPLHKKNWFGVGGPAEVFFQPADTEDLSLLLKFKPDVPMTILGAGSNVLIRDGGIAGLTIHLGKEFAQITCQDDIIVAGAGASLMEVARFAESKGISGFEFLGGIPGSVGGGVRMNAGALGSSMSDRLIALSMMTPDGLIQQVDTKETQIFDYRTCFLPTDWIVLEASFKGQKVSDSTLISQKMAEYKKKRDAAQPKGVKTAGSFFKNPPGLKAWELIERAGMRDARVGGACVSSKHANFIINDKNATARDIEELGQKIAKEVLRTEYIELDWEVKRLGVDKK